MKCPKCQIENPETRKFCKECGSKLILVCPNCHSEIGAEFDLAQTRKLSEAGPM